MKIIRSGGTNASLLNSDSEYSKYGFGNFFMLQIKDEIDDILGSGGKVAVCVAAKPNKDHYDKPLVESGFSLDSLTILGRDDEADWSEYDAVMLLGGETRELDNWLKRTGFAVSKLKKCKLLAGDSAGAYVLGAKTILDYEKDGSSFEIVDGYMPDSKLLVAAHVNNSYYHLPSFSKVLEVWCSENGVKLLELEENEMSISEI